MRYTILLMLLFTCTTACGFQLAGDSSKANGDKEGRSVGAVVITIDAYHRVYSVDGKRSWLEAAPRWERFYMAPGRWRDVRYNKDGTIRSINIEDTAVGKVLQLNMMEKEAMLKNEPSGQFGNGPPFGHVEEILKSKPVELVGQRDADGVKVNVFRHSRELSDDNVQRYEIWVDAESKRIVRYTTNTGDGFFDPSTDPDRDNPPEKRFSKGTIAGVVHRDIVFDAELDPSLFSLTPPEGFTNVEPPQRPEITEGLMLDWLELSAQANGDVFVELDRRLGNMQWHNSIVNKPEADRSETEQRYLEVMRFYQYDGIFRPVLEFADVFTEPRSYRYLGKGVKLGSEKQIVCFYKLKKTGKYRAVYGDLRVLDIDPKELPLPID